MGEELSDAQMQKLLQMLELCNKLSLDKVGLGIALAGLAMTHSTKDRKTFVTVINHFSSLSSKVNVELPMAPLQMLVQAGHISEEEIKSYLVPEQAANDQAN